MEYKHFLKYPHLGPFDTEIWNRFISKNPDFFMSVDYDVKVGQGRNYSLFPDSVIKSDMEYLSKKRIDVVGFYADKIYIIELKFRATFSAVGQVKGLAELYEKMYSGNKVIVPCIISNEITPDMPDFCRKQGVSLILA